MICLASYAKRLTMTAPLTPAQDIFLQLVLHLIIYAETFLKRKLKPAL